jgi:hypothetical protein
VIGLTDTTHTLEVVTTAAVNTDYHITYVDTTITAHTPGSAQGTISTATTTTVLAAPAASTYRGIKLLTIINRGTVGQGITVQKDVSGTNYQIYYAQLYPNESIEFTAERGFQVYDSLGRPRGTSDLLKQGYSNCVLVNKVMTAADAQYYHYCWSKDAGSFLAWSPGAPGVNGRATDGTDLVNDYGCVPLTAVPSGYRRYINRIEFSGQYLESYWLYDVLWVNSGLAPATTTAQAITTPALPARDIFGASNGEGCMIGLLVGVATTNAAVVYNSTVNYTNSAGTNSRTATLINSAGYMIPATAVAGTIVWFALQAGDTGVKSIEGITLGTTLAPSGSPTIFLLIARILTVSYLMVANAPWIYMFGEPGLWVPTGACILGGYQGLATQAAPAYFANVFFIDK